MVRRKENEYRRALIPKHLENVENCGQLYVEEGYGDGYVRSFLNDMERDREIDYDNSREIAAEYIDRCGVFAVRR